MDAFPPLNDSYYDYGGSGGGVVGPCAQQGAQRVELALGPYVHSVICILGLLGNGLVVVTYACYKRTRSMTDVYLLNVAVADLLFVAALPLVVYNELSSWSMGAAACKLLRGSYSVNLYSGVLLLACVGADRYAAIVRPHRSFRLRSLPSGRLICGAVWGSALLLSFPTFYFYDRYDLSRSFEEEVLLPEVNATSWPPQFVCEFRFSDSATAWNTKMAVPATQLAVGFFLPLVVIVFCYAAVIATLLRVRSDRRHKAVRVVLAVVVVFVACHLPYNLALLYDTVTMFETQSCDAADAVRAAKLLTQTVAYLHCCLNPVLYAFVGVKFRNHFKRIVQDLCCLGRRRPPPRRPSRLTSEIYVSTRRSVDGSSENGSSFTV
ncbi:C-C chemokine receptor type 6a [Brachionichthys hirsutus]|uniref:C-C chemokine receptor type 6a n=1 Tax=Brachionichthys hirsutus TaxID=412623 RepID=UPI0036043394